MSPGLMARFVAAGVCLLPFGSSAYACTTSLFAGNVSDSISFTPGGGFFDGSQIISAIGMWQTCPESNGGFPLLEYNNGAGINIIVERRTGQNPDSAAGCGEFTGNVNTSTNQLLGGSIVIYEISGSGRDCASTAVETLAHEMGHALGLGNSTCAGFIMSGNTYVPGSRSVQAAECDKADEGWTTSVEIGDGGGGGGGTENPNTNCPLLLDLDGAGVRTTSLLEPAPFFDPDGDGIPNLGGWTDPAGEEAFVWIDVNGDDAVNRGELLGTGMQLPGGALARNGFQVLRVYDRPENGGNGDGRISEADAIFHKLRLWVDRNHDGVSQESEISAARSRVEAIDVAFRHVHAPDGKGNVLMLTGTFVYRHGSTREVRSAVDIGFRVRSLSTK